MNSKNPSRDSSSRRLTGDIVAFSGFNLECYFINAVTYGVPGWGAAHIGIICDGLIFESNIPYEPCAIQGVPVDGVQAHDYDKMVAGYKGRVWHYRLARHLNYSQKHRLRRFLYEKLGSPYDGPGARKAAAKLWSAFWATYLPESLTAFFCSELVAAAHREAGLFGTQHVGRWSPNALLRAERRLGLLLKPVRCK